MIERSDVIQTTCGAVITNQAGDKVQAAAATCSIRPLKGMSLQVEWYVDINSLAIETVAEIRELFAGYIAGEFKKAAENGIPVTGGSD